MTLLKKLIAEFIGTMILVLFGCGAAVAVNSVSAFALVFYPLCGGNWGRRICCRRRCYSSHFCGAGIIDATFNIGRNIGIIEITLGADLS